MKSQISSLLMATNLLLVACHASACTTFSDGLYVSDDSSESAQDGGELGRVLAHMNSTETRQKFKGTTFDFGYAYVVTGGDVTLYRTISNADDEKYEQLSISAPVTKRIECDGQFKFSIDVEDYYPNEIAIGARPTKPSMKLSRPFKSEQYGQIQPDGSLLLTHCSAFKLRKGTWRPTTSDPGLCSGSQNATLFNIAYKVAGKPGWLVSQYSKK